MARSTHIGGIRVDLTAGTAAFIKNMNQAGGSVASFGSMAKRATDMAISGTARLALAPLRIATSFKTLAATAGGMLALRQVGRMIGDTVDRLDEAGERSRQLGLSAEEYSTLEYAAKRANIEQDAMNNALKMGAKNLGEFLLTGKGGAAEAFQRMGIDVRDAAGQLKGMGTLIEDLGDAFDRTSLSQPERLKILADIFGKQGAAIERIVAGGKFREYRQELQRLGGVVTGDQVKQAQLMSDAIDRMGVAWKGLKAQLVTGGAPAMTDFLNRSAKTIADLRLAATGSTGGGDARAIEQLRAVRGAAVELGKTAVIEIGRFGLRTVYDLARVVIQDIVPMIGAEVGHTITDLIPGTTKSLGFQIRKLRDEWDELGRSQSAFIKGMDGGKLTTDEEWRAILVAQAGGLQQLRQRRVQINSELAELRKAQDVSLRLTREDESARINAFLETMGANWRDLTTAVGGAQSKLEGAADAYRDLFKAGEQPAAKATDQQKLLAAGFMRLIKLMRDGGLAGAQFAQDLKDKLTDGGEDIIWLSETMRDAVKGFAADAGRSFADLVVDGKASFSDLAKGWAKTLISMATQYLIFKPIFDALGRSLGFAVSDSGIDTPTNVDATAKGGIFHQHALVPFATGGIVNSPQIFPLRGGRFGLRGEAGPEAVLPLERRGGILGVRASGGGGVVVNVIDQRSSGARPQVQERRGPDGRTEITVMLRDEVRRMFGDGDMDRTMGAVFGLRRVGATR